MLDKNNYIHQPMVLNITIFDYPKPDASFCYRDGANDFCVRYSHSDGYWYLHCNGEVVSCKAGYPIGFISQHHAESFARLQCFYEGPVDLPGSPIYN